MLVDCPNCFKVLNRFRFVLVELIVLLSSKGDRTQFDRLNSFTNLEPIRTRFTFCSIFDTFRTKRFNQIR
jgi:hypothetical protein